MGPRRHAGRAARTVRRGRNPPDGPGGGRPACPILGLPTRPDSSGVKLGQPQPRYSPSSCALRGGSAPPSRSVLIASARWHPRPTFTAVLFFAALPFLVIAAMAAWKQRNVPSAARVERATNAARVSPGKHSRKCCRKACARTAARSPVLQGGPADYVLRRKNRWPWSAQNAGKPRASACRRCRS